MHPLPSSRKLCSRMMKTGHHPEDKVLVTIQVCKSGKLFSFFSFLFIGFVSLDSLILGPRRRRNRSRGQLMVANVPTATLKFDTDFDFDSSNAQFMKEEKEMEGQDRMTVKGWFISSSDPCTTARLSLTPGQWQ